MTPRIDHLVIGAAGLARGVQYVLESIGAADLALVRPLPGNRLPFLAAEIQTPSWPRVLRSP